MEVDLRGWSGEVSIDAGWRDLDMLLLLSATGYGPPCAGRDEGSDAGLGQLKSPAWRSGVGNLYPLFHHSEPLKRWRTCFKQTVIDNAILLLRLIDTTISSIRVLKSNSDMFDIEGFAKPWLEVSLPISKLGGLRNGNTQFEKQVGRRLLIHGPTIPEILTQYEEIGACLAATLTFPAPDLTITTTDLEIRPGLKVRIYTPREYTGSKPVCIFYHGGGWAMGDLDGEDIQVRTICRDAGVVIVSVDYRLAPQHPYPAPFEDCVFAYHWSLQNKKILNTAPGQAFTFGSSAGGNLALSVALKIIDEGKGETLMGVVAVVPVTIAPEAVPERLMSRYTSYEEHAEHTVNTKKAMKTFFGRSTTSVSEPVN